MRTFNTVPCTRFLSFLMVAMLSWIGVLPAHADVQPSVDNNVLFLHYDPGLTGTERFYMDADPAGPAGEYSTNLSAGGNLTLDFPRSPPLAKTIYPVHDGNNIFVRVHMKVVSVARDPFRDVCITVKIGEARMYSNMPDTSRPDYFLLNCTEGSNAVLAGTRISVEVALNASAQTEIHFHTDGTSNMTFKLGDAPDIGTGERYHSGPTVVNWNAFFVLIFVASIIAITIAAVLWPSDGKDKKDR